jgi:hypothetical protein
MSVIFEDGELLEPDVMYEIFDNLKLVAPALTAGDNCLGQTSTCIKGAMLSVVLVPNEGRAYPVLLDEAGLREAARRFLMMADDLHETLEHKGDSNGQV